MGKIKNWNKVDNPPGNVKMMWRNDNGATVEVSQMGSGQWRIIYGDGTLRQGRNRENARKKAIKWMRNNPNP